MTELYWGVIIFSLLFFAYLSAIGVINVMMFWKKKSLEREEIEVKKKLLNLDLQNKVNDMALIRPDAQGRLPLPRDYVQSGQLVEPTMKMYMSTDGKKVELPGMIHPLTPEKMDLMSLWQEDKLPKDKFLIGYRMDNNQPVYANWQDMCSTIIGGKPKTGKSTFARLLMAQIALQGGRFVVIDPHQNAGDQSLTHAFRALKERLLVPAPDTNDKIIRTLGYVDKIVKDRLSGISRDKSVIVLITDETNSLLADENVKKYLQKTLADIALQGRKVNVYALSIGQSFHATALTTDVRNSYISFFSTYSRKEEAKIISGNAEFASIAETLNTGEIVWMCNKEITTLRFPNVTSRTMLMIGQFLDVEQPAKKDYIDGEYTVVKDERYNSEWEYKMGHEGKPMKETFHDMTSPTAASNAASNNKHYHPFQDDNAPSSSPFQNHYDNVSLEGERPLPEGEMEGVDVGILRQIHSKLINGEVASQIIKSIWGVESGSGYIKASKEYNKYIKVIASRAKM